MKHTFSLLLLCCVSLRCTKAWTTISVSSRRFASSSVKARGSITGLQMGVFDSLPKFLQNREGDFVKLEDSEVFGPGPMLLLYGVPSGIKDDEINDMIHDSAPQAYRKGCRLYRIDATCTELDLSLRDALEKISSGDKQSSSSSSTTSASTSSNSIPVLFFSGFRNDEMLNVYNLLGKEIYEETGGQASAACAKAVPNAMQKPFRQVIEEISGDHEDAMSMDE